MSYYFPNFGHCKGENGVVVKKLTEAWILVTDIISDSSLGFSVY